MPGEVEVKICVQKVQKEYLKVNKKEFSK